MYRKTDPQLSLFDIDNMYPMDGCVKGSSLPMTQLNIPLQTFYTFKILLCHNPSFS